MSDAAVRELLDKQALLELVTRFCRAVDRCDADLLLSCYHADAFDDHGTFKGGPAGLLAYLRRGTMDPVKMAGPIQHSITNSLFEIHGDVAYGETYVETRIVSDGDVQRSMARNVDRFERRNGEWRIAHRRIILEHARPGFDTSDFTQATRDRNDPSYERGVAASPMKPNPTAG